MSSISKHPNHYSWSGMSRTGQHDHPRPVQRGFVLIASLLILIIVTLLGISMFRSYGLQEKIAGNLREKERAFQSAQSALQFAEQWLTQKNHATAGTSCIGSSSPLALTSVPRICSNSLPSPDAVPWVSGGQPLGVTYAIPQPGSTSGTIKVSTSGGTDSYYALPRFYIQNIGPTIGKQGTLFRITTVGWGGNKNAVAVIQSTYLVSTAVQDLSN